MPSVALTGNDTVTLAGRTLADFGDGDIATLTFPNELMAVKTGKNGNSIYAFNETGKQAEVVLRVLRNSSDDKFLNRLLSLLKQNPAGFILMAGTFVKRVGNGLGFIQNDTYILSGGVFTRQVDAQSNVEGNTDQAIAVYTLMFTNAPRQML